jgi:hypothetical protein
VYHLYFLWVIRRRNEWIETEKVAKFYTTHPYLFSFSPHFSFSQQKREREREEIEM